MVDHRCEGVGTFNSDSARKGKVWECPVSRIGFDREGLCGGLTTDVCA